MTSNKIKYLNDKYIVLILSKQCGWCTKLVDERLDGIKNKLDSYKIRLFMLYSNDEVKMYNQKYHEKISKCMQNTKYVPCMYFVQKKNIYKLEVEINETNTDMFMKELLDHKK